MKPVNSWAPGRRLYAIAAERWTGRGWVVDGLTYLHAINELDARITFLKINPSCRVVAAAEPVGYFCDKRGENVRA